jgi:hypothetical protein
MQPIYTRARGVLARDRNLAVPWAALREVLLHVAVVSRSVWRYKVLRYSHAYYITHDLQARADTAAAGARALSPGARLLHGPTMADHRTRARPQPFCGQAAEAWSCPGVVRLPCIPSPRLLPRPARQAAEPVGRERWLPKELVTWFSSLQEERERAAAIPLTPEGAAAAAAAEEAALAAIHTAREAEAAAAAEAEAVEANARAAAGGNGADGGARAEGKGGGGQLARVEA